MVAADGPKASAETDTRNSPRRIGSFKAGSFLAGLTIISVFAGFGFTLARVKKKNPTEFSEVQATKLALKALGLGTALSVTGAGLLVAATKWILQVNSVEEFASSMRQKMPEKDGDFVKKFESWKLPRKGTNDDSEWEKAVS